MDVRLCRISAINSTTLHSRFLLEAIPQGGHHWQSISTLPSDEATQVAADEIDGLMEAEVSLFFRGFFPIPSGKLANRHGRCSFHLPFLPSQMVDLPIPLC